MKSNVQISRGIESLFGKLPPGLGRVGIVLSGGNVDFEQLAGF